MLVASGDRAPLEHSLASIFYQILPTNSLKKCMEMSLENFYVDTGAKRNRPTSRRQQKENSPQKGIKLKAKTMDEDPASYKRWISRKEI